MDKELFESLLKKPEGLIDFKRDQYHINSSNCTDESRIIKSKTDFIKDILSMANTPRSENAYIITGVKKHSDGSFDLVGIDIHIDDNEFQSLISAKANPVPGLTYQVFEYNNMKFGIFTIPPNNNIGPYICKENMLGDKLKKGVLYFRRGSQNVEADGQDFKSITEWFRDSKILPNWKPIDCTAWEHILA